MGNSGKWQEPSAGEVTLNGTVRLTIVKMEKQGAAICPECWETNLA